MKYKLSHYRFPLLVVLATLSLVPECFAGKVQVWMDKKTDLALYKTYQWLPPKLLGKTGMVENDPEFAPLIKDAINGELSRKGLKESSGRRRSASIGPRPRAIHSSTGRVYLHWRYTRFLYGSGRDGRALQP